MMPRRLLRSLAVVLTVLFVPPGATAGPPGVKSVATPDGTSVTVLQPPVVVVPGRVSSAFRDEVGGGLAYEVRELDGVAWHGVVPGTRGQVSELTPSLACNPATADVLLAFTRREPGADYLDGEVLISTWLGQRWTEPGAAPARHPGAAPVLTFREGGDSLLLWRERTLLGERLLLRHADLTAAGEGQLWSFSDLGDVWAHLGVTRTGADPRRIVTWLVAETGWDLLHVIVADSETGRSVVLTLDVTVLRDGGNGTTGAAPVPVSFHAGDRVGAPQPHSAGGRVADAPDGSAGQAWRLLLDQQEAFYWQDTERLLVYVPDVGPGGTLLCLPAPENELQAPALALRALRRLNGGGERRPAVTAASGARRLRR